MKRPEKVMETEKKLCNHNISGYWWVDLWWDSDVVDVVYVNIVT